MTTGFNKKKKKKRMHGNKETGLRNAKKRGTRHMNQGERIERPGRKSH